MYRLPKLFLLSFLVVILALTIYVFASSNTGGDKRVGEGQSRIGGWEVSNIRYILADDPSRIKAVEFDLNAPAWTVRVGFIPTRPQYSPCMNTIGYHWRCEINPEVDIASVEELRVIGTGD